MPADADDAFYARADAHIHLANDQLKDSTPGKVSASMMFAASRFNAWRSATGFDNAEDMKSERGLHAVSCGTRQLHFGAAGANGLAGRCLSLDIRR